jgi:D-aminoacyl-tRNA deacylase
MQYRKFLVVASKRDKAGVNITTRLSQFRENPMLSSMKQEAGYDFYLVEDEIIYTENLSLDRINKYDFIIFASRHSSEKKEKTLSIHAPGNWRKADYGGQDGKVCKSSALFQKQLFEKLKKNVKQYQMENDYAVTMEVTHHGPLIDKPCVFIEIGATDAEWTDRRAGFIVAKTISETIKEFKENPYNEVAFAIGGPHYCPSFNKIQESSNVAISHVIPKYALPLTDEMIKEAVQKTDEEVDFVLLDWKGIGSKEERDNILEILGRWYLQYRKTSDIKK